MENERIVSEYGSILDSIYESSKYNDSDYVSICTNAIEDIRDGNHVYPEINARDAR